jgi:hypothetical protein
MPPILDTAVGTIFVFLLFSLVVSALNEYILSLTDQRAKFLRMGLAEIFGRKTGLSNLKRFGKWVTGGLKFGGDANLGGVGQLFLNHGLINSFSRSGDAVKLSPNLEGGTSPSYIPAGAFVTALFDIVGVQGVRVRITRADAFLKALKGAKPADGSALSFATFDAVLGDFLADDENAEPAAQLDDPLAAIRDQASDARLRATVQNNLAAAIDFAAAQGLIDQLTDGGAKAELNGLVQKAEGTFPAFSLSVGSWFSADASRYALELAVTGAIIKLGQTAAGHTKADIEAGINALDDPKLKASLLSLFRAVDGDLVKFKTAVEGWFNGVMDRVSGWYKRFSQKWIIAFAFILAAFFNVDTLHIVRELSRNPNLSQAVSAQAEAFTKGYKPGTARDQLKEDLENKLKPENERFERARIDEDAAVNAAVNGGSAEKTQLVTARTELNAAQDALNAKRKELIDEVGDSTQAQFFSSVNDLKTSGIPIGWRDQEQRKDLGLDSIGCPRGLSGVAWVFYYPWVYTRNFFAHFWQFLPLASGWLLTAIAASVGAPFWFDLLGRFINIRAAGRAPGEKEATSNPVKPPPATIDTTPGTVPAR